jgi:uncharacterized protein YaaN involved in tellurite resistance
MPPKPIGLGSAPKPPIATPTAEPSLTDSYMPTVQASAPVPAVQTPSRAVVLTMDEASNAGGGSQMAIAEATKKITAIAKTSDMDELGKLLSETLMAAKGYDMNSMKGGGGGIFGFLKRKGEEIRSRYEKVDGTVTRLVGQIDQRVNLFATRVNDLKSIAVQNRTYHDALTDEIVHMEEGVAYMEANPPAVDPTDSFSAQKAQEWQTVIAWARKRADDLRRAQIVAQQQDAQINLMVQNSTALTQKFKDLKVTTLPLLQQTFTLYIINMEQAKGAEFATSIDNLSDETMKKNAALLGQNTVAIQTSLNRSNFSVEAITANHDAVLKALDDIERIRAETKTRLANEAPLLEQKSRELAARLAQRPNS